MQKDGRTDKRTQLAELAADVKVHIVSGASSAGDSARIIFGLLLKYTVYLIALPGIIIQWAGRINQRAMMLMMVGVGLVFFGLINYLTDVTGYTLSFAQTVLVAGTLVMAAMVFGSYHRQKNGHEPYRTQHEHGQAKQGRNPRQDESESSFISDPPAMDFDDVAGMESLKGELAERVIEPLTEPEKFEEYGLSVERGILLHGPPGTGKTHISKALAGELGVNFMNVKASTLISKYVGEGTQNVSTLFDEARENQPCMVFIDEIDALTPERGGQNQHQDQTQMVNQFLQEVSDINEQKDDVIIIAATNRRDQIDDAMLRSGRLTVQIEVPYPDTETKLEILDAHLNAPRKDSLDIAAVHDRVRGLSAADMEAVAQEAAHLALKEQSHVGKEHLIQAIKIVDNRVNE